MADTRYIIDADVNPAIRNLNRLNNEVNNVSKTMQNLTRIIGGLAIGAFVRNALSAANAITDLSASTDISVQSISALSQAFQENSGSVEGAIQSINRLTTVIGEARLGNARYIESFKELGISLNDLRTQGPDRILQRTITELGRLESSAERSALALRLIGRAGAATDLRAVGEGFAEYERNAARYASALEIAGKANQQLANTLQTLQREFLVAIEPLLKFTSSIDPKAIQDFIQSIITLVQALAGLFILSKVLPLVTKFGVALFAASNGLASFTEKRLLVTFRRQLSGLLFPLKSARVALGDFATAGELFIGRTRSMTGGVLTLLTGVTRLIPLVGALTATYIAADFAVKRYTNSTSFLEFIKQKLGIATKNLTDSIEEEDEAVRRTIRRWDDYLNAVNAVRTAQQAAADNTLTVSVRELSRELDILNNVAKEDRQQFLALAQATDEYNATIEPLLKSLEELNEFGEDVEATARIQESIDKINETYQEQVRLIKEVEAARRAELQAERAFEARIRLFEDLAEIMSDGQNAIRELNNEMAALTMGTLDRELLKIQEEQQAVTERANAMAYALYEAGAIDYSEYLGQLNRILELESQITKDRQEAARQVYDQQRQFSVGWQQAFNDYAEAATNNAQAARNAFETFTSGMEDAIVKFAQTGKLSFRDLVNDMIAQLIRLMTQKALMAILGGATGGAGLAALFGGFFADGGRPPMNKVSIVGERGPELFVPNTAGTIIPNHELGAGSAPVTNNYITNNISAIDSKSVAQLFAENRRTLLGTVQMAQRELP